MENKRIALVRVECDRIFHPLSVLYVGGALKKAGYEVHIFNLFEHEIEKYVDKILAVDPLFVGFSVLTGKQTRDSAVMSTKLRERNKAVPIVWGGVHPSMLPTDCLKEDFIDMVCLREGEDTICEIAEVFNGKKDPKDVLGIGYKDKRTGEPMINPYRPFKKNLDDCKPDWESLSHSDFEKSIGILPDGRREIDFVSSRGCPHNCAFCYNLMFNERRWRACSPEFVIREIAYLKEKYNIRAVVFQDDHFFVNKKRALYILEELKKIDVVSTSCMVRMEFIDEEFLQKLIDLGVMRIFLGWESGNDRILKLINKGFNKDFILEKFKIIAKFPQLGVTGASIIGFPTQTLDEIFESVNIGIKLAEMVPNVVITYQTYIPFPGSHLYGLAKENGFVPPSPGNIQEYGKFDTYTGEMPITWLPWATDKTKQYFYRIDKYGKLLTHSKGSSFLRSTAKKFFYYLAKLRLRKRFFAFPFEIFILHRFNRYFNPKCSI